jgi:hypothetical protein
LLFGYYAYFDTTNAELVAFLPVFQSLFASIAELDAILRYTSIPKTGKKFKTRAYDYFRVIAVSLHPSNKARLTGKI